MTRTPARTGALLAVASMVAIALAPLSASTPSLAPSPDSLVAAVPEGLGANLGVQDFHVPLGQILTTGTDLLIQARNVVIDGAVIAEAAGPGPAASIRIQATGFLVVRGSIVSGDAKQVSDALGDGIVEGPAGQPGGSVELSVDPQGLLSILPGALIRSGDGSPGGAATSVSTPEGPSDLRASGGDGGKGGDIVLMAPKASILGTLVLGSGGEGGHAFATAKAGHPVALEPGLVEAVGGDGGAPGVIELPPGFTWATLVAAGTLQGAAGAAGGDASAVVESPLQEANGKDDTRYGSDGYYGGDAGGFGNPGGHGTNGGSASATGGNGSPNCQVSLSPCPLALSGGRGGDAKAVGGDGGSGGRGSSGKQGLGWFDGSATYGGAGGNGGKGGSADARGGNGACGGVVVPLFGCGRGGNARAESSGGHGGRGGNGGWSNKDNTAVKANCITVRPACWIEIAVSWTPTCGHVGPGGLAGARGSVSADPGSGGKSLVFLLSGPDGSGSTGGISGTTGSSGTYDPTNCPAHVSNQAHNHL